MTAPLKADQAAAERLLKAAVRRAVEVLREPGRMRATGQRSWSGVSGTIASTGFLTYEWTKPCADDVEAMLRAAGESAELLLSERAPKKAAS